MVNDTVFELKSPIAAVLEHIDMLEATELTAEQRGYLDVLRRTSKNMQSLVTDLLDLARLERGQLSTTNADFDLQDSVESIVSMLVPAAYRKRLDLALMVYRDVPARINGDAQRLQQVLSHILTLAIENTAQGGISLRVMLDEENGKQVKLRFAIARDQRSAASVESEDNSHANIKVTRNLTQRLLTLMHGEFDEAVSSSNEIAFIIPFNTLTDIKATMPWTGLIGRSVRIFDGNLMARRAMVHHTNTWGMEVVQQGSLINLDLPGGAREAELTLIGLHPDDADRASLQDFLSECKQADKKVVTLINSFDEDLHRQLRGAGASASLPKSTGRLTLYRVLNRLLGSVASAHNKQLQWQDLPVLVADDVEVNRRLFTVMLKQLGANATVVDGGVEALAQWKEHRHPLVLLDVRMPDMDGPSVATGIRQLEPERPECIILGVTAALDAPLRRQLLDSGMDDCILKPSDRHSLMRDLAPWVQRPDKPKPVEQKPAEEAKPKPYALLQQNPELVKLLIESLPGQLENVETAVRKNDANTTREEIHQLHGTAAFYRLDRLKDIAGELEAQLKNEGILLPDQLPPLRHAVTRVVSDLEAI